MQEETDGPMRHLLWFAVGPIARPRGRGWGEGPIGNLLDIGTVVSRVDGMLEAGLQVRPELRAFVPGPSYGVDPLTQDSNLGARVALAWGTCEDDSRGAP